jgi:hypothetical protein
MTEFAVGAAMLALLMLGTITIAGYQEVQRRAAIMAPQLAYAQAWAGSRNSMTALQQAAYRTHLEDPALTSATGRSRLARAESLQLTSAVGRAPGQADVALGALLGLLQAPGGFFGNRFDLQRGGYLTGGIAVRIPALDDLPEPFRSTEIDLSQPYAMMTDAWNSGGPQQVRRRTSGLVPTQALAGVASFWRLLLAPLSLLEPALGELCLGQIEPDRIPEDRLGAGFSPLPRACT